MNSNTFNTWYYHVLKVLLIRNSFVSRITPDCGVNRQNLSRIYYLVPIKDYTCLRLITAMHYTLLLTVMVAHILARQ